MVVISGSGDPAILSVRLAVAAIVKAVVATTMRLDPRPQADRYHPFPERTVAGVRSLVAAADRTVVVGMVAAGRMVVAVRDGNRAAAEAAKAAEQQASDGSGRHGWSLCCRPRCG